MTRKSIIDCVIAGVILLLIIGAYSLWYGMVSKTSAEAAQLSSERSMRGEAGGRTTFVRRALQELEREESQVYRHFVGSEDIVPFLEGLETTGERLGSSIEVVSVGSVPQKPPQPGYVQVALRITGSFDAVMRTIGAIEYQSYDTTLMNLTLDRPSEGAAWTAALTFLIGMEPSLAASTATSSPKTP